MLNPITAAVFYTIEMLISYMFFSGTTEMKRSRGFVILTGFIIFQTGAAVNMAFNSDIFINTTVEMIINAVFLLLCFKTSIKEGVFFTLVLTVLSGMTEIIAIFSFSAFSGEPLRGYNSDFTTFMAEYPVSKMLYLAGVIIVMKIINRNKSEIRKRIPYSFLIYPAAVAGCVYIFWIVATESDTSSDIEFYLVIGAMLLSFATIVLFVTWQYYADTETEQIETQTGDMRTDIEKTHYEALERQNQQLMLYAHDMKKHLSMIQQLNKDHEIDEYINTLTDKLNKYSRVSCSGNLVLDAVLERYSAQAEIQDIKFTYEVRTCNLRGVDDTDIVTILGNILDNAFRAAEPSQKKSVLFDTTTRNGYSVIIVTNSCDTPPVTYRGELVTTKEKKLLHGIGIKSVKRAIKKYKGDLNWRYEADKKKFTMTVILKEYEQVCASAGQTK